MSDRSIYWSLTINNPNPSDEENIATARQRGWVVEGQVEAGEQNGTPHYQLMVNTRVQQRFSALKKVFPRARIEAARNPAALKQYVHKVETRVAELPNSARFLTSQKQLWDLVVDELESAEPPKKYRIRFGEEEPYDEDRFDALEALDYAADQLIRKGYYCVETMVVNPQTRSAFQKFWKAIIVRRQIDRQTDRQNQIKSVTEDITDDASTSDDTESETRSNSEEQEDHKGSQDRSCASSERYGESLDDIPC